MPELVYILCVLASTLCAVLLFRAYLATRTSLLLWSAVCFAGLAANNVLLFVDVAVVPTADLSVVRTIPALGGLLALIYALIWSER